MTSQEAPAQEAYRFAISPQDAALTSAKVKKLLAVATTEAAEEALADGYDLQAKSDLEGGFLGAGEITALLVLAAKSATVAKIVAAAEAGGKLLAKSAVGGVGAAGGKLFFDKYLSPRLRKMNLLPSKFQPARKESPAATKKKKKRGGKRH
jgi:hypothetical protein